MAGSRLVDASRLVKAARGIVLDHVSLRRQQSARYQETSSLWASLRHYTQPFFGSRDSSLDSTYSTRKSTFSSTSPSSNQSPIVPKAESSLRQDGQDELQGGLDQDHFYEKSSTNSTANPLPKSSISITQAKAGQDFHPDGGMARVSRENADNRDYSISKFKPTSSQQPTRAKIVKAREARQAQRQAERQIPSHEAKPSGIVSPTNGTSKSPGLVPQVEQESDASYSSSLDAKPEYSSLPRVKLSKASLNIQDSDERVAPKEMNQDVFYSSKPADHDSSINSGQTLPDRDEPDEQMYSELFHSPKAARLLQKKPVKDTKRNIIGLQHAGEATSEQDKAATAIDQETFTTRDGRFSVASDGEAKRGLQDDIIELGNDVANEISYVSKGLSNSQDQKMTSQENNGAFIMRESRVPSSRIGRLWQYGGLATSMAFGAVSEGLSRFTRSTTSSQGSLILSGQNMERLVTKLSRMRGAALKLGQMMSFQDSKMLPTQIHEILQRVQDSADYMPASQRNGVLSSNLGPDWSDLFSHFDEKPLAAASIGQVHGAVLKKNGMRVAVKIQYPGVSNSIDSDLNNLSVLLTASRLLPKGLYLDKTIANARVELAWECDYEREAKAARRFKHLLSDETSVFHVPEIIDSASTSQVLTMERMEGIGVTKVKNFTQQQKDWIGTRILRLCLREIVEFQYMQTDPNWTNFLYNSQTSRLELLDFGASRDFPARFIDPYIRILQAAAQDDRDACRDLSIDLGYLTGHESKSMLDAHVSSIMTLAEPFRETSPEVYDFRDQTITDRVRGLIPIMIRERLAPPPEETYSLHRKLSGAFLLCARLGSRVRCRELFRAAMEKAALRA